MENTIKRKRALRNNSYERRKKNNIINEKKILKIIRQIIIAIIVFAIITLIRNINTSFTNNISNKVSYFISKDSDFNSIVVASRELFSNLNITNEKLKSVFSEGELNDMSSQNGKMFSGQINEKIFDYTLLTDINFIKPAEGILFSGFGNRINPITKDNEFHYGIDIATNEGNNIYCVYDGVVDKVGNSESLGNYVKIRHPYNLFSIYAHALSIDVKQNELVSKGEVIGKVGSTGWSEGPHLHFELLKDNKFINCEKLFNFSDNEGVISDENNS